MALARLALKNLRPRVQVSPTSSSSLFSQSTERFKGGGTIEKQRWSSELVKRFSTTKATDDHEKSGSREIDVSYSTKKSKLFLRRKRRRGLWRNNDRHSVPALSELFPSGLGNAIVQATENMSRVLENLSPSRLLGRFKEKDECYKLKYYMPGVSKEDVKITIEDGVLIIRGEHKEEEEEGSESDDEHWSSAIYGYYNTSVVLPEDAKVDEIKAELKDGVLYVTIPKAEGKKKDVKEVQVQ